MSMHKYCNDNCRYCNDLNYLRIYHIIVLSSTILAGEILFLTNTDDHGRLSQVASSKTTNKCCFTGKGASFTDRSPIYPWNMPITMGTVAIP